MGRRLGGVKTRCRLFSYVVSGSVRQIRTSAKAHLKVSAELEEVIIGTILGDLGVERPNPRCNTRLQFKQTSKKEVYVAHMYLLFKEFCGSPPKFMSRFDARPSKMKEYGSVKFNTFSLPCFNVYRELFYSSDGVKIIPSNLGDLLTARGLAGGGGVKKRKIEPR